MVRSSTDHYFVEIPNSENDRVATSLHVCELLPSVVLEVGLESVGADDFRSIDHNVVYFSA